MFHRACCLGLLLALCSCRVSSRWDAGASDAGFGPAVVTADAGEFIGPGFGLDAAVPMANVGFDAGADAAAARDAADELTQDAADSGGDPNALPTNISFETARHVELGSLEVWQTLHNAEQVDYYAFEAEAGHFYALSTSRGSFSPENVITLYDPDHKFVAENDEGGLWPGDAIDARLVVRLPRSGTYYVVVEDRSTPPSFFNPAFSSLFYQFVVRAIDSNTPGFALESSSDTAPAQIQFLDDARSGNAYVTLVGDLSEGDRDSFSFAGRNEAALIGDLLPPGPEGDSSTALLGRVRVANAQQHAVGYIDRARGQHNIHPPIESGDYQLTVTADGQPGNNGFYAVNLTMLLDNPREQYTDSNDKLAMAEPLSVKGTGRRRSFLLAYMPPGDVDYYSFEVPQDYETMIVCEGESAGSGVHALRAEVRDDHDQVMAFAVEELGSNLLIEKVPNKAPGTRYLRLSSETTASADMIEPWARCLITVSL